MGSAAFMPITSATYHSPLNPRYFLPKKLICAEFSAHAQTQEEESGIPSLNLGQPTCNKVAILCCHLQQ
jgi:hypothetical protein